MLCCVRGGVRGGGRVTHPQYWWGCAREHAKQPVSRPTRNVSLSVRPPSWISLERERGLKLRKSIAELFMCGRIELSITTQVHAPARVKSKMVAERDKDMRPRKKAVSSTPLGCAAQASKRPLSYFRPDKNIFYTLFQTKR